MRRIVTLFLVIGVLGCAPAVSVTNGGAPATVTPAASPPAAAWPRDLLWVRTAAEHRAIFLQTFRAAQEKLVGAVQGRAAGTWAVIADADETLVDLSLIHI